MADSPTPQQESKDDGVQLPEIGRSDSRTSLKQHQEAAKEDNSNKKATKEATPRSNSPPHSDRKNESRDERRESQSEPQDQNNTTSPSTTTKGAQQQQQETTADQSKDSSSSPSTNNNTQTKTNTKSEPQTENKKKIRFEEEEDDSKKKNNQTKNQDSNSTKNNKENKNDNDNGDKNKANKKENSSRKGNETKSPRKEKEAKKSPRKEEDETKGSKKGHRKGEDEEEEEEDEAQGGNRTNRSGDMSSRSSTGGTEMSEGRSKQHEFFKNELKRLESSLKRESSKIIEPQKKAHTPFIFNTLEPYYNTKMTRFLIELPDEMKHGHTSRRTAQGLTDPWLDLKMDRDILPKVNSTPVSRQVAILKKEKEIRDRKKRSAVSQSGTSRKEGSTRLPKFPMVQLETQDLAKKQLNYSHVPGLRTELKNKYSSSARTKIDEDFKRTHADFYRMELDKLDEVHPVNRGHMKSAYFAYLQNTPGSKKAINECVKGLKSGKAQ